MHSIFKSSLLGKRFLLFIPPILFSIILITLLLTNLSNSKKETLEDKKIQYNPFILSYYNLCTNPNYKHFDTDILGVWYLDGYNNIYISFNPDKSTLDVGKYQINSLNIDVLTLNSFDKEYYTNQITNWDLEYIKEYYNLELINGEFGTLLLSIDGNVKVFRRSISPNAKEGIFLGNSNCNPSS